MCAAVAQTPVTLPPGVPLRVALEQRLPIDRRPGRPVRARVIEPVYLGNQLVVPKDAELVGRVAAVHPIGGRARAGAILRADFTPLRTVSLEFSTLESGSTTTPVQTFVTSHDGQMVRLGGAAGSQPGFFHALLDRAKDAGHDTAHWFKSPGKMRSLKDWVEPRLPLHPQWLEAGTRFDAELAQPMRFVPAGPALPLADASESIAPPTGAVARARLVTPLDSGTAKFGDKVSAVLTEPLLDTDGRVLLGEGARLEGTVNQVRPARHFARGGVLRFTFRDVVRDGGPTEALRGTLLAAESPPSSQIKIDAEGGATAQADSNRTLSTVLALRSLFDPDGDSFLVSTLPENKPGGIGFLGLLAAVCAGRGSPVPIGFGAYNFGHSLFTHWLARGHQVDYPKNTEIELRLGLR